MEKKGEAEPGMWTAYDPAAGVQQALNNLGQSYIAGTLTKLVALRTSDAVSGRNVN
jgi:hypothetical protein